MVVVVVLPSDQDFAATDFSFRTTISVCRCASWSLRDAISRSLLSRISCILAIDCASLDAAAAASQEEDGDLQAAFFPPAATAAASSDHVQTQVWPNLNA
jgi:hypothetical protein